MEHYCIYCGNDGSKHFENCPLIVGIPQGVLGFYPKPDDLEWNLHLGRMSILTTLYSQNGKVSLGPLDDKIRKRLSYESTSFNARRFNIKWLNNNKKLKLPLIKNYYERKYNKEFAILKKSAEAHGITDKEFQDILTEKVLLANYSGKGILPFYRNVKTGRLVYLQVE